MQTRCLGGFSVMWVTKLLISPVKIRIFARPCRLIWCPVGGCGARAVSRKTPIYFIISIVCSDKREVLYPFNPYYWLNPGGTRMNNKNEIQLSIKKTKLSKFYNEIRRKKEIANEFRREKMTEERGVQAVLLQDIFSSISASTVVLKMDIQGYECKVCYFQK